MLSPAPGWHEIVPQLFVNRRRFLQTGKRRFQVELDGLWAGIAVAFRPFGYANFGLNCEDLQRLIEKVGDGSLAAGFVVQATIAHREAEAVCAMLKDVPPLSGPHGDYWLLQGDFDELDNLAEAMKRF
jgi:hypothetical protein